MFWVFCNFCFAKPGQGNKRQFFMTSCSHILCSQCTRQDMNTCKKCNSTCIIVQCNSQMPEEVKEVFSDVCDNIPYLMKVLDFQGEQQNKLMEYYKSNFQRYKSAKAYIRDVEHKFSAIKQKYEACKNALNKQQNNFDVLLKKYHWYKENYGCIETPSKMLSSQFNASQSKVNLNFTPTSFRQLGKSMNTPQRENPCFTPTSVKKSSMFRNISCTPTNNYRVITKNHYATPESIQSSHKSSNSSGSLPCTIRNVMHGFTPPAKSFQHLSLTNKKKNRILDG